MDTGCSLIKWERNRTWCTCTHLTDISSKRKELSISLSRIIKNRNTLSINYETIRNNPVAPVCVVILIMLVVRLLPEVRMLYTDR